MNRSGTAVWLRLASLGFVAVLLLPVLGLLLGARPALVVETLSDPGVRAALSLSLRSAALTVVLTAVLGTPCAWYLARSDDALAGFIGVLVQVPVVLPPAVAGLALLFVLGPDGLPGLSSLRVPFSTAAVVVAQFFVSAPLYVRAAAVAFSSVPQSLLDVSTSLGRGRLQTFMRVVLPLSSGGVIAGAALTWARALGEFGATLLVAGNLPGVTQTVPTAIYVLMERDMGAAVALSSVLVYVSLVVVLIVSLSGGAGFRGASARDT